LQIQQPDGGLQEEDDGAEQEPLDEEDLHVRCSVPACRDVPLMPGVLGD
jgi:hypothetical protein